MEKKYTAIVRKSRLEYVAMCLELNVSAAIPAHNVPKIIFSIYVKTSDFFAICCRK